MLHMVFLNEHPTLTGHRAGHFTGLGLNSQAREAHVERRGELNEVERSIGAGSIGS
jgi:hypothetical protein